MSAYMVDRNHVVYLVKAAYNAIPRPFHFWYNGTKQSEYVMRENKVEVAQALWDENKKSVVERYGDSEELPGPIGEDFVITEEDFKMCWLNVEPVQVLKACNCFEYQACEHREWPDSFAYAFIQALIDRYIGKLPGYDDAKWGAPDPNPGVMSLTDLLVSRGL